MIVMKRQKNKILIDGNFILDILYLGMIGLYYLGYLELDWYSLGYWTIHIVGLLCLLNLVIKLIKFIYKRLKKNNGSDV